MNEKEALLEFGRRLQSFRIKQKISQERLAELSDLDRTYISSVERGRRNISLINIIKIATALNITPSDLLIDVGVRFE